MKDALRGKGGDEKSLQELAEHREEVKAAKQKAEEVSWLAGSAGCWCL